MKKIVALTLALLMIVVCFAGCKQNPDKFLKKYEKAVDDYIAAVEQLAEDPDDAKAKEKVEKAEEKMKELGEQGEKIVEELKDDPEELKEFSEELLKITSKATEALLKAAIK